MEEETSEVTSGTHLGRGQLLLAWLGVGTAAAMLGVTAIAPCDPDAPIMSLDSTRLMPPPYANVTLLLNIASPILLGLAAARAVGRPWGGVGVGFVTWFVAGFTLYFIDVQVWKAVCPA